MTTRRHPARRALGTFAPIVIFATLGTPAPASPQTQERALYVSVVDANGAPVESVTPADLVVREDGVSREILRVAPATDPMQIAVLVDTSAALSPDVNNVRQALLAFVRGLVPAHEVALVEYGDRPNILTDSTTSLAALEQGIGRIFPRREGGAYLLDAIVETARGIQKRESPRPVIVVVSAEGVEFGNYDHQRVLDALRASGAALHVLTLNEGASTDLRSEEIRQRNIVYDRGTRETGGSREILLSSLALEEALRKLSAQLTHQVKVTYSRPATLIPPEKITVEAKGEGRRARGTPVKSARGA